MVTVIKHLGQSSFRLGDVELFIGDCNLVGLRISDVKRREFLTIHCFNWMSQLVSVTA